MFFNSISENRGSFVVGQRFALSLLLCATAIVGCGTTKTYVATEQLLLSDAVDTTVAKLDCSPLSDHKVYLDTTYLKTVKSPLLIDSDYVISSLRQQMVSTGVLLVEQREDAEIIAEARIGALGMNGHDVIYGIPASNSISSATAAISGTPLLPAIPEISFARREGREGSAKIAVFAYDRETRQPYWQSGIAKSKSTARDLWVFGMGPFQKGSIRDRTRFAGTDVLGELVSDDTVKEQESRAFAKYSNPKKYPKLAPPSEVISAGAAASDGLEEASTVGQASGSASQASAAK